MTEYATMVFMKLFSGSASRPLALKIAKSLDMKLSPREIKTFADGERRFRIKADVTNEDTVIIQSTNTPVDRNYMELFFMIDALQRSGAKSVIAVLPYLGYQRQDHVFRDGEVVSLEVIVRFLESLKIDSVIALDLHSIKIPELFHIPVTQLSALPLFAETIKSKSFNDLIPIENSVIVSPDGGGIRRVAQLSKLLGDLPWLAINKERDLQSGQITINGLEGSFHQSDLSGKRALIVDDIISSGKTIMEASEFLKNNGVLSCDVFATHALFSEDAAEALQESYIDSLYVTNAVTIAEEKEFPKLHILSVVDTIAKELKKKLT